MLLGAFGLLRRRDAVWSIGFALVAKAAGHGFRWSAARLGVPSSTVRGWLRRFATHAEEVRVWFTVLAHDLDPLLPRIDPTGTPFADAVEAVGMAARAAEARLGVWGGLGVRVESVGRDDFGQHGLPLGGDRLSVDPSQVHL